MIFLAQPVTNVRRPEYGVTTNQIGWDDSRPPRMTFRDGMIC
jgi:hypothetical protein